MKKTYKFQLPQNKEVKSTGVSVENGEILVDVEFKERFEPKDGDFLERLEKELHKRWNAETKQFEDIRWKPKEGETYWFIECDGCIVSSIFRASSSYDWMLVTANNCFKTKEAAQPYANQIKEIFKNSKAE